MTLHLSLVVLGLLFSLCPHSAIGTSASIVNSSYIRLRRDQPDNSGDGSSSSGHHTKTTAHSSTSAAASSATNLPSGNPRNANTFHKEAIAGIMFGIIVLAVIVWLIVQARRKNAKEQASNNPSSMAKDLTVTTNRSLPPIPSHDSTSEIDVRQPPAVSSRSYLISGTDHVRLDDFGSLPNPFDSESDHPHIDGMRTLPPTSNQRYLEALATTEYSGDIHRSYPQAQAAARARTPPTAPNHRNSEEQPTAEWTYDDTFSPNSLLVSPPSVHRSLTFSSALTATANGPLVSIPEPPPSPSEWISRSPAGSRRTSTLYEDLKVYQKGLEADAKCNKAENAGESSSQEPPPKYIAEEPRISHSDL